MGCSTVFTRHLQMWSNLDTLVLCTDRFFFPLFPLSAHPMQPPARCQHSRCSDHTWDPLTDPFQDFWGEMKTLGAKQEVQQVKTLSAVVVTHLSGARVSTCAGARQAAAPTHPTTAGGWIKAGMDKGRGAELPAALLGLEPERLRSSSSQGQLC